MTALTKFLTCAILLGATVKLSEGSPVFIRYPPSNVTAAQGDDVLLTFTADGTAEHDALIIQGPDPLTGSNKLKPIYERGTEQDDKHEPFKGNFSVSTAWSEGITVVNLTILDFQLGDVGTYKCSVGFLLGPEFVTDMIGPDDDVTVNTTVSAHQTTMGSLVNATVETTGYTSGGGLPGWAIGIIVAAAIIIIASAGIYAVYRRWDPGTPPQDHPVGYAPVENGDGDPGVQVLNGIAVGRHGGEVGAEEANGAIRGGVDV